MVLTRLPSNRRLNIRLLTEGFELLFEAVDDPLRVGDQALIGGHTQHHAAGVAEDADAQAEVTGLRDPEHHVVQPAAGEVQRFPWTGYVGQDGGGLDAEETKAQPL